MRLQAVLFAGLFSVGMALPPGAALAQNQPYQDQSNQNNPSDQQLQQVRSAGYNAGFRDGVNDYRNHSPYNFQNHPVYQNASGDNQNYGVDQPTYQAGFRTGYESGYDDGYYGRSSAPTQQRQRSYSGEPAYSASGNGQGTYQGGNNNNGRYENNQPGSQPSRRARNNANVGTGTLPAGTVIDAKLNNTLSTRASQRGDNFTATVSAPVYAPDNQTILVPQGSTIAGTVQSVQRAGSVSGQAQMQLNITALRLPNGNNVPLRAQVSQVTPQGGVGGIVTGSPSTNNEGGVQQSQTRNTVGTAAAGGAAGAIIGAIAGGGKGAGIGGLVGAGLGVLLASHNGNLDLPVGTAMSITTDQPVQIR